MPLKIERVCDSVVLGEGPHWDVDTQSLYYVDIMGKSIHKFTPSTNKHTKSVVGTDYVSLIIPVEGAPDKFLISMGSELAVITWDGSNDIENIEKIGNVDSNPNNRINDGKADPSGRLWAGTMAIESTNFKANQGSLYSYEKGEIKTHFGSVSISNGLAWNAGLSKFYYIDSYQRTIDEFDFDINAGTISNRKVIFTLEKHGIAGLPDGQTIDTNGHLWVAVFNGGCVLQIDPKTPETLLQTIKIPAKQVTSVVFGGPNLDELYVTSARVTLDEVVLSAPDHGSVYKITGIKAKGLPSVRVKI